MAFYSEKRQCYVCKGTNKRLKGLAKNLRQKYWPEYRPPVWVPLLVVCMH